MKLLAKLSLMSRVAVPEPRAPPDLKTEEDRREDVEIELCSSLSPGEGGTIGIGTARK